MITGRNYGFRSNTLQGTKVKLYLAAEDYLSWPMGSADSIMLTLNYYNDALEMSFVLEGLENFDNGARILAGINRQVVYSIEFINEEGVLNRLSRCRVNCVRGALLEGVCQELIEVMRSDAI